MNTTDAVVLTSKDVEVYDELFCRLYVAPPLFAGYLQKIEVKTIRCINGGYRFTVAIGPTDKVIRPRHYVIKDSLSRTPYTLLQPDPFHREHTDGPRTGSVVTMDVLIELKPGDRIFVRSDDGAALKFTATISNKPTI